MITRKKRIYEVIFPWFFCLQLYASVKLKMEEMQQHNMSWIEVQFLKNAVDVLCQCRQTLMFTYVFAFYLKKNNQSIIFEVKTNDVTWALFKIILIERVTIKAHPLHTGKWLESSTRPLILKLKPLVCYTYLLTTTLIKSISNFWLLFYYFFR